MNRIVLIGNGFDLAHGLKTSYADFINWYWDQRVEHFVYEHSLVSEDVLCTFESINKDRWHWHVWYLYSFQSYYRQGATGKDIVDAIIKDGENFKVSFSPFFERINKSIETKGWVDIENEYYELLTKYALKEKSAEKVNELNTQLHFLQDKLVEYLSEVTIKKDEVKSGIKKKIYSPFKQTDISVERGYALQEHLEKGLRLDDRGWAIKLFQYDRHNPFCKMEIEEYKKKVENKERELKPDDTIVEFLLPDQIMLLDFNYTQTAQMYYIEKPGFTINHIHGVIERPQSVIFGYGDELDERYKELLNQNDNTLLNNIKSVKYLESNNYRKVLSFIEAEPYQILIMGHSCGNSDRTLLNTLFEHKNCVSIKPYFYKRDEETDNYLELIQNISRNFTDMKLMRDRVVNKTYCEPLT